jgi:allantoin racemase
MALKLWYQSVTDIGAHPGYGKALNDHFKRVQSPGTSVSLHGMAPEQCLGLSVTEIVASPYTYHEMVHPLFLGNLVRAERQGYGAFCIGSFSEPALREMRSLGTIPVVSVAEASMLAACTVAPKFGLLTLSRIALPFIEKSIATHHLHDRVTGIHLVDENMPEAELDRNFDKPAPYIEKFIAAARVAIEAGADAIIPAEGLVAAMISANNLREVDGVPIVDAIGATILFAELQVTMQQRLGLNPSRKLYYARPHPKALEVLLKRI